jgi:hypothetical protein
MFSSLRVVHGLLGTLLIASLAPLLAAQEVSSRREDGNELYYSPAQTFNPGNYHVLNNGVDSAIYAGFGAGGSSVPGVDGIGTWIPGEELRGNCLTTLGDFGYRQMGFRETVTIVPAPGPAELNFPYIAWVEFDGANGHNPTVFSNPTQSSCPGTLLGVGGMPYGAPPAQASFLVTNSPTAPFEQLMIPNEHLISGPGTATVIAEIKNLVIPILNNSFTWEVQIEWVNPLESRDDIDGWYRWMTSSPNNDQYFSFSEDELNLWQSHSIPTAGGVSSIVPLPAQMETGLLMLSADPVTHAALAPVGFNGTGPYYTTATPGNPNNGFDLGRGSQMVSFSGTSGVTNIITGFGNQDPAGSPTAGLFPALGFVTFDNTDYDGDNDVVTTPPVGGYRIVWVDFDLDVTFGIDPAFSTSAVVSFGNCRVPIQIPTTAGPWPSSLTMTLLPILVHATAPVAWPDPGGYGATPGEFGIPMVAGATLFLPLGGSVCLAGLPIALQYGSSGLLSSTGPLTWDPLISRISGTRQIFLFD